ncbi:MAG: Rrf2 family transcriptional regulator [Alphaproteobacteria bacterium]
MVAFGPTKKLVYAVEAVLDIAFHAGIRPVQSREITQRQGIPARYLEPVLQQLVRTGILTGIRGPRGGYRLAKERRYIVLGDILRVVQAVDGDSHPEGICQSPLGRAIVGPLFATETDALIERFNDITLETLCQRARANGLALTKGS